MQVWQSKNVPDLRRKLRSGGNQESAIKTMVLSETLRDSNYFGFAACSIRYCSFEVVNRWGLRDGDATVDSKPVFVGLRYRKNSQLVSF